MLEVIFISKHKLGNSSRDMSLVTTRFNWLGYGVQYRGTCSRGITDAQESLQPFKTQEKMQSLTQSLIDFLPTQL